MNERQKRFADEYLVDLNQTQAAIRAGYSERTAFEIGRGLFNKVDVRHYIQERLDKRGKRLEITADRVLQEIAKVAFSDMSEFAEWRESQATLIDSNLLDKVQTACIQEVSGQTNANGSTVKIKLYDKLKALEVLGKHLKLFNEKIDIGDIVIRVKVESDDTSVDEDDDEE